MSTTPPAQSVGQISADGQFRWDGQRWEPLPPGYREATPWTRPMQLAAGAFFILEAVASVVISIAFINHDSMLRAIQAQGTTIPQGTTVDAIVSYAIAVAIGVVVFIAVCEVVAAIGSLLGWRWMFWVALVLFALGGIGVFTNLVSLLAPAKSAVPLGGLIIDELLSVISLALFVWLLVGLIKFGPWAMRKVGR